MILTPEYRRAKNEAIQHLTLLKTKMVGGPVAVRAVIYAASHRRDMDGYEKLLWDVLEGIAYQNDRCIHDKHVTMNFSDKYRPRYEVEIRPYAPL